MRMRLAVSGHGSAGLRMERHGGRGLSRESFRLATAVVLCGLISSAGTSRVEAIESGRSAEELLRLVPPDATVVVTVEGLRDQVRTLTSSRLMSNLRRLPAVRAWFQSEHYRNLERSCNDIEAGLGVKLAELRDDLIGDAVVLVLRLDPDALPDPRQARGLLLLRARDPGLLERVIERSQRVATRERRAGPGHRPCPEVRRPIMSGEFPAGAGRPPEWYVSYPDGTFAFSNSEALIQGVIDRKARMAAGGAEAAAATDGPGLGDLPKFKAVQRRLPERALARLFVDPRAIERLLAAVPRSNKPSDVRIIAMLERYLAAVDYGGAVLTWGADAIVVHAVETLDPSRLDPWLRRWAGESRASNPTLRRVPPTALALASAHVDAIGPSGGRLPASSPRTTTQRAAQPRVRGDRAAPGTGPPQPGSCPRLGPGLIAYLDSPLEPPTRPPFPDRRPGERHCSRSSWSSASREIRPFHDGTADRRTRGRRRSRWPPRSTMRFVPCWP